MVKSRRLAHRSTLYNIQCFSSLLTRQPIPCDRLMDVPKGALILFCQGLAVTQGLFSINKQEWRKWQPSQLLCTGVIFSRRIAYLHLLIYLARAKKRSTTHLLSAGIISSYSAAERARWVFVFLTASPKKKLAERNGGKIDASERDSYILFCASSFVWPRVHKARKKVLLFLLPLLLYPFLSTSHPPSLSPPSPSPSPVCLSFK